MDTSAIENAALPVFLFVIVTVGMGIAMIASGWLVGPHRQGKVKAMPYESGMDPIHDTRRRFDVRFHLVAIAFLVFDVELLFLYPWAVASRPAAVHDYAVSAPVTAGVADAASVGEVLAGRYPKSRADAGSIRHDLGIDKAVAEGQIESRGLVFGGAMAFIALLLVGLIYDWRKGVFQWR